MQVCRADVIENNVYPTTIRQLRYLFLEVLLLIINDMIHAEISYPLDFRCRRGYQNHH